MRQWIPVGPSSSFPDARLIGKTIGGHDLVFVRNGAELSCFHDRCTHIAIKLSKFGCVHRGEMLCNAHGARFDCQSGSVLQGPAMQALKAFAVKTEGGQVYVEIDVAEHQP